MGRRQAVGIKVQVEPPSVERYRPVASGAATTVLSLANVGETATKAIFCVMPAICVRVTRPVGGFGHNPVSGLAANAVRSVATSGGHGDQKTPVPVSPVCCHVLPASVERNKPLYAPPVGFLVLIRIRGILRKLGGDRHRSWMSPSLPSHSSTARLPRGRCFSTRAQSRAAEDDPVDIRRSPRNPV